VRTERASVSLIPEFSSVAICCVKSISWVLLALEKIEKNAVLRSELELISETLVGWMLRARNCIRAA